MRILIAGCGYIGLEAGRKWVAAGHEVWGIRRSTTDLEPLHAVGIRPIALDLTAPPIASPLPPALDVVLNAVSTKGGELASYEAVYRNGTQNLLDLLQSHPLKCYLMVSSTSVYGQTDGSWVDEECPAQPDSPTSRVLTQTEQTLLDLAKSARFPVSIFRAAGIYGPERGHLFHQFLRNEARLTGDGSRWLNMIHRDDLVNALVAGADLAQPGQIYNVADDEPVTELEFFAWLSKTLGRPMPPPREATATRRKRGATNKRIANSKIKKSLRLTWTYPTFREGYLSEITRLGIHLPPDHSAISSQNS